MQADEDLKRERKCDDMNTMGPEIKYADDTGEEEQGDKTCTEQAFVMMKKEHAQNWRTFYIDALKTEG